jgi:hypothetical protein
VTVSPNRLSTASATADGVSKHARLWTMKAFTSPLSLRIAMLRPRGQPSATGSQDVSRMPLLLMADH